MRQVVWEDLLEKVTLDQRPDGSQTVSHTDVWEKSIRDKVPEWDCAWHVGGKPRSQKVTGGCSGRTFWMIEDGL